ncbi:MAG: hypothetical protein OEX03_07505 [Gammaproteobacteria bacterium]|nr:hypothetical protein [Gammaproteobacteria bacterium]
MTKRCDEVFGVSHEILEDSYVDRGNLDKEIARNLSRKSHIALRGASKCGKSWLRQKSIPDALVVQCRLKTTVTDIYTDALSQLGIRLVIEEATKDSIKGKVEATATAGFELITKLKVKLGLESNQEDSKKGKMAGHDINDLRFISDLIKESGKRLVIEDFHYLSLDERKKLSFDLKALWDYGCFVVIIGVWTRTNLLIALNPDLSDRIIEIPVEWSSDELSQIIRNGGESLKLEFGEALISSIVNDCYNNAGLLQKLVLAYLDEEDIETEKASILLVNNIPKFESAAMSHAEQLDTLYQQFAKDVSSGIRKRKDATGIYAHAMAAIVSADDELLLMGFPLDDILAIAHGRQPRIIKTNLRTALQKLEELQVDEDGRGLVIAFNEATDEVSVIDRRLLFYRKYLTILWPWEDMIQEADEASAKESPIIT